MQARRLVICERCSGEVEKVDDLVTTFSLFSITAYHNECYTREIKGMKSLLVSNVPINGTYSTLSTILLSLLVIGAVFLFELPPAVILLTLLFIGTRLYSYLAIERHVVQLEEKQEKLEKENNL